MTHEQATRSDREPAVAATLSVADELPPMFPGGNRIGTEEEQAVLGVIRARRLFRYYGTTDGPSTVEAFERDFASSMGSRHAIAVASGTTALATALAALGIGPGDEVIVPAYTWVSTPAAVLAVGAVPVIAEVDETLTLDVDDAAALVNPRTRAILPVHMRGAPADLAGIGGLARRHGLAILEDAAQALGGRYRGRRLGSIGDIGAFSLQYNKIITCGEGGVVTTDDARLHARALMYQDVAAGQRADLAGLPRFFGITCRMSELQGAVAGVQLGRLDAIIAACRANREGILGRLADLPARAGIRLRACHDEAGDTGIAIILLCPDARTARLMVDRLRAARLTSKVLFDPQVEDLHVAAHWGPILERRSWSARTPWDLAEFERSDAREGWARSREILSRAVHLDVSPDLSEGQVALVARVVGGVLAEIRG